MLKVNFTGIVTGTPAEENTALYVDPSMIEALVGEIFSITISIADVIDFWGYEFKLGYNNTILNATEAFIPEGHFLTPETPGMFFPVEPGTIHQEEGYVYFAGTLLAPEKPKNGSGILGTISFLVTDEGESNLTLFDTVLVNEAAAMIPHDVIDGYFATSLPASDNILIEEVIVPEELTTDLIAFKWPKPLKHGDVITPSVFASGLEYVVEPNRTVWLYWINDCPYAMFAHDTRYVVVDAETGDYEVFVEEWGPMVNGVELWSTPEDYWNTTYWIYSTMSNQSASLTHELSLTTGQRASTASSQKLTSQSKKRALIIEGHDQAGSAKNASELWYELLMNFDYSDQEIVYLTPTVRQKTDYICTKENVTSAVQDLSDTLDSGDDLTLFIIAHGDIKHWNNLTGFIVLNNVWTLLYDWELSQSLSQIKEGVHITVVLETCYSASFMDDLWMLENVEILITSTDWKSVSYTASKGLDPPKNFQHIADLKDDPNFRDEGGEFSSGLIEGLDELKEQFINGTITVGELYVKAFKTAKETDAGYINGKKLAEYYNDQKKKPNPLLNMIYFAGDITHDGKVNILDISKAAIAFGSTPGGDMWDPEANANRDRAINILDISAIATKFGTEYFTNEP